MEEAPLLLSMDRVVGGVEVQHDHFAASRDGLHRAFKQQRFNLLRIGLDLAIVPIGFLRSEFQPIQRTLAGQRFALVLSQMPSFPKQILPSTAQRQQRIVTQTLMIIDVLIAKREAVHALLDENRQLMFDIALVPKIREALAEPLRYLQLLINFAQQQRPAIRREVPSGEIRYHLSTSECLKSKIALPTVCLSLNGVHDCLSRCLSDTKTINARSGFQLVRFPG